MRKKKNRQAFKNVRNTEQKETPKESSTKLVFTGSTRLKSQKEEKESTDIELCFYQDVKKSFNKKKIDVASRIGVPQLVSSVMVGESMDPFPEEPKEDFHLKNVNIDDFLDTELNNYEIIKPPSLEDLPIIFQ